MNNPNDTKQLKAERIRQRIEEISAYLKGHSIPYLERMLLHEERNDLRAELETLGIHCTQGTP